ncbi:nucleotide exchange factor GrpE [Romboutsia maritimum]|uniref:Protein GrpE n=2 Tax=Romboutsia maritimum TaxID=2020948 RepID=A0A371IU23_9FIRM|nr:nucleotide exchange factor GrpE [Romboutsia maritimum]
MEGKNMEQEELKTDKDNLDSENLETQEQETETVEENSNQEENITYINAQLVEKLKNEIEETNDKYQRVQAEYSNYRRRTQEEKETIGLFANEKLVTELIPVIDNMERALEACTNKEDTMYQGIELVYKQLKDTLAKFGVEEIETENVEFDPNLHQAVMEEDVDGVESNKIIKVFQKGYKLGTKTIRASMVVVSR